MQKIFKNIEEIISSLFLVILISLIIFNVFVRFTTGISLIWAEEIAFLCFAWVSFIGASVAYKHGMHPGVDTIVNFFPEKISRGIELGTNLLMLVAIGVIIYLSAVFSISASLKMTPTLHIPYSFIDLSVTVSFSFMFIHNIQFLRKIIKGYSE